MKQKLLILSLSAFILGCTSSSVPVYNRSEFKTENYQKNVDNALSGTNLLSDFEQSKTASKQISPEDISNLVQGDLYYNQGDYVKAFPFYNQMSLKYKDPRVIYKAIICLGHLNSTPEQIKILNDLVQLFIQAAPNSKLAKLFQIKIALNNNNINLAKQNVDELIKKNPNNTREILLFISSIISVDISNYSSLDDFALYIENNYGSYPEAHLVAILSYSVTNNEDLLSQQINYINENYKEWSIPLYWSLDVLVRQKHIDTLIKILEPIVVVSNPDRTLQSVYVAALLNSSQNNKAKNYLNSQLNGQRRNDALLDLGILYSKNNDYSNALSYFNQVTESEPQLLTVLALVKGSIYDYQGNANRAIEQYKQVQIGSLVAISQIMLLNAYLTLGDYQQINAILDKYAIENKLNDVKTILLKSSYYFGEGKYSIAYEMLKSKFSLYQQNSEYLYQYAAVSGTMGYTKDAIKLYNKFIKQNPEEAAGYNDLAYIYAKDTKDYKLAKKYALKAYEMTPGNPNVLDTLGFVYYKLGDYNKALPYIKTSYEFNHDPESGKHLIAVYEAMNRHDLASQIIILDKANMQKKLKEQLIGRAVTLVSDIQFGVQVK
jgi:tetratricopeptide (TPR) repeat protein